MDFLELVKLRHSVRQYSAREVEKEKLEYVLECARLAPSAVNKQPWHFYVVQGAEVKRALDACYVREWFAQAPLCIVACVDDGQAWVRSADGKNHADIDVAIAVEHICLAAAAQGLGSCWVCNFDVERCAQVLQLPEGRRPVALIPIGYPLTDEVPAKGRKGMKEIATCL